MALWLRNLLMALLVVGIVWSAAVAYWRDAPSMPTPTDLVLVMLGLPLLLLSGLWLGRRLLMPAPAVPAAAAPAAAPPPAAPAPPALTVLASSLRMPHGGSSAELLAAIERGNARATLDPELLGDDGYCVMSVRAQSADDVDAREQIGAWLERHGDAAAPRDETLRALLLGSGVAAELAALAADTFSAPGPDGAAAQPTLQLALLLPGAWDGALRRGAADYLRQVVADNGWPDEKIALRVVDDAGAILSDAANPAPLTLLLACASHVGEHSVDEWSADLTLFSPAHQQGLIPGEGAAGLLLGGAAAGAPGLPQARLSGASGLRDTSADSERRPNGTLLGSLVLRTLDGAAVPAHTLGAVVADTGHRTSRLMELMGLVRELAPHLDAGSDVISTGASSGSCADAGFIAAVALAAEQADKLAAPVLCVANEHPFRRCALVLRPGAST